MSDDILEVLAYWTTLTQLMLRNYARCYGKALEFFDRVSNYMTAKNKPYAQ